MISRIMVLVALLTLSIVQASRRKRDLAVRCSSARQLNTAGQTCRLRTYCVKGHQIRRSSLNRDAPRWDFECGRDDRLDIDKRSHSPA